MNTTHIQHTVADRSAATRRIPLHSEMRRTHNLDYARLFEVVAAGCPQPIISVEKVRAPQSDGLFSVGSLYPISPIFPSHQRYGQDSCQQNYKLLTLHPSVACRCFSSRRSLCERQAGESRGGRCQTAGHDRRRRSRQFRAVFASFMAERRPSAGVLCD